MASPRGDLGIVRGKLPWRRQPTCGFTPRHSARCRFLRTTLILSLIVASGLAVDVAAQLPRNDPPPAPTESITIAADSVRNWTHGESRILLLHGNVYIAQGLKRIRSPHAVVWIYEGSATKDGIKRLDVYADGGVRVDGARRRVECQIYSIPSRRAPNCGWR